MGPGVEGRGSDMRAGGRGLDNPNTPYFDKKSKKMWWWLIKLCLKILFFQKQPYKQVFERFLPVNFSHTLDYFHTLDKFNFTLRSSCSQMSFKIGVLNFKNFATFRGKHLFWSLFLITLQVFRPGLLIKRDSNTAVFLWILRNV